MDAQAFATLFMQFLQGQQASAQPAPSPTGSQQPSVLPQPPPALPPATIHPSIIAPAQIVAPVPVSAQAAAPIEPYRSLRPQASSLPLDLPPLPRPSVAPPAANINSIVNRARLAHSGASQLRVPSLQPRRARNTANPIPQTARPTRPTLPRAPNIQSCLFVRGGETYIRTVNVIFPPLEPEAGDIFHIGFLRGSFLARMRQFGLIVEETVPVTTLVTSHIRTIVDVLHSRQINIDHPAQTALLAHEGMPLIPLYVGNRGVPRPSDNQIRLRRSPLPADTTIANLAASRLRFAIPGLSIETINGESYLTLNFVIAQETLTATFALPGPGQEPRLHRCIPRRIHSVFPQDREFREWGLDDGASSCANDDVANLMDVADDVEVASTLVNLSQQHPRANGRLPSLPASIWDNDRPWPLAPTDNLPAFTQSSVYVAARGAGNTPLHILYSGDTVSEAADELLAAISQCVDTNDFTDVLSEDENAILYWPRTAEERDDGGGEVRSLGEGVLREIYMAAYKKVMDKSNQWLTARFDGKLSLVCVLSLACAAQTPGKRQHDIAVAGALFALLMIRGISVDPIDVCLLQFLLNDCDLRSLHPGFVGEWHPALRAIISTWKSAGPAGSINKPSIVAHLGTYLDLPIQSVETRDQATHDAIAVEFLYRSVIASQPPRHCDLEWLFRGFRLSCRNGFEFPKFVRDTAGGSEAFLNDVMASVVGPDSLIPRLVFPPSALAAPIVAAMDGETLADLFHDFLSTAGIPCPHLFEASKPHFSESADLTRIDSPNFRAQMLTWATTGQPFLPAGSSDISIILVGDDDPIYLGGTPEAMRQAMIESGTISYRTCFRQARIPASFLLRAATAAYDGPGPRSRRRFLHHWLLCQILGAVGDTHTFN